MKLFVYSNNYITFAVQLTTRTAARRITERNIMNKKELKTLDEVGEFLGIDLGESQYRDAIIENNSIDNGEINVIFSFIERKEPLYLSIVQIEDIFNL